MSIKSFVKSLPSKPFFMEILLIASTFSWGMAYIWIKQINDIGIDPNAYIAIRYFMSSVIMTPFCLKELKNITKKEIIYGSVIGILMYTALVLQTYGLIYTTPANSGFITSAYVVFVPFTAWIIMKQKPSPGLIFSVALCLAGIYVLTMGGETLEMNMGNMLTLCCALCWSVQVSLLSKAGQSCNIKTLTIIPIYINFLFAIPGALLNDGFSFSAVQIKAAMWPIILCALFPTIFSGFIQTYAQKYIAPSKAAIIYTLESVFAMIVSVVLGMEKLTITLVLGGGAIILAIALNEVFSKKREKNNGEIEPTKDIRHP